MFIFIYKYSNMFQCPEKINIWMPTAAFIKAKDKTITRVPLLYKSAFQSYTIQVNNVVRVL